ncbi:MAG: hypothetical protein LBJ71_02550 [Holosporaceae bacterium]|jgi:hypothetical protein|nr:hypothetical protein [Holosporaceae bacterium]
MTDILEEIKIGDTAREILQKIDEAWPSPIVLRKDITKFSCGLVTTKTMASMDCEKRGIPNTKINGKVAYNKKDIIQWLASKIYAASSVFF